MEKIKLKKVATKRVKEGYPLLVKGDFLSEPKQIDGRFVELVDDQKQFVAKGYLAKQNKGDGWVLTTNPKEEFTQSFFERLFLKAEKSRNTLKLDESTTAYRFFNGEGDGLGGLTIDYYADYYVFSWYSEGIYTHHELILKAFQAVIKDCLGIYQKFRYDLKGKEQVSHFVGKEAPAPLMVLENGIRYATYLDDGLMTGIFLDQREVRETIREHYSMGKTVLNTFSYTGAFSIAAAMGGASETTSVDLANRSLPKTKEQFEVNGIDAKTQRILVMDVFDYFKYALKKNLSYDTVIIDPPSFARSKKRTFSVAKDYQKLLEEVIAITNQNGVIVASTNAANVTMEKFESFIQKAFETSSTRYSMLEKYTLPNDFKLNPHFPEGDYLKVCILRKK
ncbi:MULTISPECIES: class I SAM-dependent rRNA methyltransferase [Carnobacterium]|uniref:class I SAM-dependent rRNA methyltransferase n=1 Tax=Carnobacterium TaxID=2747 RepID=UPI0010722F06|nr:MULTISPECIES: class I SAM-dependent rRNA methyltransferase [Carnobacterium]MDT1939326.1 class I SAM-dependent rRNA methyltransferase [Carnobacterium divergens]MDT1941764.1 class I SAM-dependent rRNA methyltransferase [Carnobacterium divergens]MDT1947562.1 class I SAM-dependent rRNA methyltransferase [Carnobacterium divergens]MDT1950001.1 class I SAM-dependent rRNA methyltransferase [Carnobacterium divergens]MDT1955179.1 class I SAM-dependent rRNA methyltransferase [Carnobacterium divergens]